MTDSELKDKVAKFVHGVDSHGNFLSWGHGKDCLICGRMIDFVGEILQDYNKAEGVFYPTEDEINARKEKCEPSHLFNCPACKVQGYCDGRGFCLHETHSFK